MVGSPSSWDTKKKRRQKKSASKDTSAEPASDTHNEADINTKTDIGDENTNESKLPSTTFPSSEEKHKKSKDKTKKKKKRSKGKKGTAIGGISGSRLASYGLWYSEYTPYSASNGFMLR